MRKYKRICSLSVSKTWDSDWLAPSKEVFKKFVCDDFTIRDTLTREFASKFVSCVKISRMPNKVRVLVVALKPFDQEKEADKLKQITDGLSSKLGTEVSVSFEEIKNVDKDAFAVANFIAKGVEQRGRTNVKKLMIKCCANALRAGAKGIQIVVSGRINGAPIARVETYSKGSVPKNIFSKVIDYGFAIAHSGSGTCGVKVYVNQ